MTEKTNLEQYAERLHKLLTEPKRMRRLFTKAPQISIADIEISNNTSTGENQD